MKRRLKFRRGEVSGRELGQALENIGCRAGSEFWVEVETHAPTVPLCTDCGESVKPDQAWRERTGWVSPHGAKSLTQSEPTGRLLCEPCLQLRKSGLAPGQESLT